MQVSANGSPEFCRLTERMIAAYGAPTGIEDCCRKAQMVNMETFKGIFEAWNDKLWNDATGVMLWMSNPCWPSLTWNTYDYYLEPTAAYFACKRANEPIHVQWNMVSGEVKVVNHTFNDLNGLAVNARIYNMDGKEHVAKSAPLDCPSNSVRKCFDLVEADSERSPAAAGKGLTEVYFIKLELKDRAGRLLSDNFYWQSKSPGVYRSLAAMDKVALTGTVSIAAKEDPRKIVVDLRNGTKGVALMTRLKLVDLSSGLLVASRPLHRQLFLLDGRGIQAGDGRPRLKQDPRRTGVDVGRGVERGAGRVGADPNPCQWKTVERIPSVSTE